MTFPMTAKEFRKQGYTCHCDPDTRQKANKNRTCPHCFLPRSHKTDVEIYKRRAHDAQRKIDQSEAIERFNKWKSDIASSAESES